MRTIVYVALAVLLDACGTLPPALPTPGQIALYEGFAPVAGHPQRVRAAIQYPAPDVPEAAKIHAIIESHLDWIAKVVNMTACLNGQTQYLAPYSVDGSQVIYDFVNPRADLGGHDCLVVTKVTDWYWQNAGLVWFRVYYANVLGATTTRVMGLQRMPDGRWLMRFTLQR